MQVKMAHHLLASRDNLTMASLKRKHEENDRIAGDV